ncbi:MAG: hypothetical protein H0U53_05660 [Actinobacteria bacterium]|nr:hypothetical protein [Actinomycetota bacterium]
MTRKRMFLAGLFIAVGLMAASSFASAAPGGGRVEPTKQVFQLAPGMTERPAWIDENGVIDLNKMPRLPVVGPDGQPLRNPDGTVKTAHPSDPRVRKVAP